MVTQVDGVSDSAYFAGVADDPYRGARSVSSGLRYGKMPVMDLWEYTEYLRSSVPGPDAGGNEIGEAIANGTGGAEHTTCPACGYSR